MATYEELHGKRVEVFDADPTLTSAYEGQVWYNETTGTLKSLVATQAWISSSPLNTARIQLSGAVSSPNTASLAFGGYTGTASSSTEEYNGSGWATGGNLGTARYLGAGAGTQTEHYFLVVHHRDLLQLQQKNMVEQVGLVAELCL